MFADWNPDWKPKYSMSDCDKAQKNALEELFPEIKQYLCDFHVKQAWDKRFQNMFKAGSTESGETVYGTFVILVALI